MTGHETLVLRHIAIMLVQFNCMYCILMYAFAL